jgi:uncharacterized membrane protein YesL
MLEFAIGVVTLLAAIGMIQHHRESMRRHNDMDKLSDRDQKFYRSQFFRRVVASCMIAGIGTLLIADSYAPELPVSLILITLVCILLLLVFAIAIVDFNSISRHFRKDAARVMDAKQAMHDEAERLLRQKHEAAQQLESETEDID